MSHPRRRWTSAGIAVALTASGAVAAFASLAPTASASTAARAALASTGVSAPLNGSEDPLGVNTATWDHNFTDSAVPGMLSSANLGLIRFPGGSSADEYNWQDNSGVDFSQYSSQVDKITNGQKLITVNYGTGTAAEAGAWADQSKSSGEGVTLWEVGNEQYGSWEADNHSNPYTPQSYATNAVPYFQAIKNADSSAKICFDYGTDGDLAPGSGASNWQTWDSTILKADSSYINCADEHWYPFSGTPQNSNPEAILDTVSRIPQAAADMHSELNSYDPSADFIIGETNISNAATQEDLEPTGALFAAANAMEWLSYGAHSVDWWDVHNYGSSGSGDFSLLSSGTSGEGSTDSALPPYYGYELASKLAVHGATVGTLSMPTANSYGYYSDLPGGSYAAMVVNADPNNSLTVSTSSLGMSSSSGTQYTYDNAKPSIVSGSFSGSSVYVPPESVVVVTSSAGGSGGGGGGGGGGSAGGGGALVSGYNTGKCVDDANWSAVNGNPVDIWDCNGGANQNWESENGTLVNTYTGKCLDDTGYGSTDGTKVEVWDCNGGSNQQWTLESNGSVVSTSSGKCLDDNNWNVTNGTQLQIWDCNGGSNQKWTLK